MMKERKEKKASNMIELGTQKMNGKEYVIGIETTRYGPAVTRSLAKGKAVKKEYGNIPKGTNVREITLDDAISMLPLSLGTWKRKNVIGKVGQYGPYL
jgi:topoisomerase IA-like protein